MIIDKLSNLYFYLNISTEILKVIEIIHYFKPDLADGKYYYNNENYYILSKNNNHYYDEKLWEKHNEYIDIHILISGSEKILISSEMQSTVSDYSKEKDISFHTVNFWDTVILNKYKFLIIFPHEFHQPSIINESDEIVRKIVFKIKKSYFNGGIL
jgi:YhcH/YjgK/YiaL family protein